MDKSGNGQQEYLISQIERVVPTIEKFTDNKPLEVNSLRVHSISTQAKRATTWANLIIDAMDDAGVSELRYNGVNPTFSAFIKWARTGHVDLEFVERSVKDLEQSLVDAARISVFLQNSLDARNVENPQIPPCLTVISAALFLAQTLHGFADQTKLEDDFSNLDHCPETEESKLLRQNLSKELYSAPKHDYILSL